MIPCLVLIDRVNGSYITTSLYSGLDKLIYKTYPLLWFARSVHRICVIFGWNIMAYL